MGKISRLAALATKREFLLPAGGTLVALLGVEATVLTIFDWHVNSRIGVLLGAVAIAFALLVNSRRLFAPQLIADDVLAYDLDARSETRACCPCELKLAKEATRLAGHCFGGSVTIAAENYEQLRVKNPFILCCLIDHQGALLGYFDAIPVRESFAIPFLRGSVTEAQITHEDVLAPQEMRRCKYLFIAGIAVWGPETHAGRRNASILVWAFLRYLERFYDNAAPLTFAVAATKSGDDILRKFKFDVGCEPDQRLDKYRLYSLGLSKDEIKRRLVLLPDWKNLCRLDWDTVIRDPRLGGRGRRPTLPETKIWNLDPIARTASRRS